MAGSDSYIQVAKDNPEGKYVDMEQVATAAGSLIQRQRAVLVGDTFELLKELLAEAKEQTYLLTVIKDILMQSNQNPLFEGDAPISLAERE